MSSYFEALGQENIVAILSIGGEMLSLYQSEWTLGPTIDLYWDYRYLLTLFWY